MKANNLSVAVCLFTFVISFAFANNPPSIDLGNNITALAGSRVQLNAIVADSDNDDVSVVWKVLYSPSGSRKEFSQFSGESTKFSLDRVGPYVIQAEVRDGTDSSIDTISIFSTETPGETVFGPVTNFASPYCRDLNHKKCVKNAFDFDITNPGDNYTLLVRNNGFVSASISLNGERLTSFYDFSGGEENLAINVSLLASNNIEVVAIGNPNASIDVLIKRNETVINNNNPPTLDVSTISYFGNSGGTADLIATAGDAGQTLFYQILKQPNNGILSVEVDTLVFKPRINTNENGQGIVAVFDDGNPQMVAVQTVDILFNDGNRAPTVRGSMEATAGEVRTFTPIIEDNSGDTHFITIDSQPLSGTVELNDLTLIYTPEPDFVGEISYLITVTDNQNPPLSTQYEVRGSVLPNFAPTLTGSFNQQVEQGNELRTNFQGSDSNSTQVTDIRIEVGPINGSASISNGKLTYQPNPGFSGNDTITLRVSDSAATPKFTNYDLEINVLENAAPSVPGSPFSRTLNVGQEFGQVVFFQDVNVNQAHILEIVKEPIGGTATLEGAFLSYAAGANFVGEDEIVVQITDDGVPAKSTLAVIQLDVRGNTVPNPGISWIRQNPNSIPSSTFVDFTILNGDPDPSQNHRIEIIQQPTNGQITPNLFWDTRFSYRSKDGYDGSDSFIVRVTDDGVPSFSVEKEFTINVINNRPPSPRDYEIAVLSGLQKRVSIWDNDPDNGQDHVYEIVQAPTQGTAVLDGIGLIYTANPDSSGQDQIIVRVRDNGFPVAEGFSNINVTIKENSAPSFRQINDPLRVVINTARSFFVRYTDRDERDGQTVAKAISQQPANGTVVINSEGNGFIGVTYTPNEDFLGFDSFQLSATDSGIPSLQDFITVVVNVIENTAPELNISSINALEGYSVPRGVVTVTDPDSTRFTYGIFASPAEGNANISDRGVVTYTPNVGFSGTDQIGIIVTEFDGGVDGLSTVGVMAINVVDNVPPEPMDEEIETFQSTPIRRNLSPNDPNSIDFRGTFRYRVLEFPANGNLEFSESFGSYTYTPAPGFSGQDSFRYEVIETPPFFEDTLTAQASVTINVTPNTSPSIDLENLTLIAGETVQDSFELLDPDNGQQLTVEVRNEPSFGNAEVVRVGLNNYRITYNSTSFQGNDSIELRVSDNAVPKGISDITIPINVEENFPPVITPLSLSVVQGESVNTQISFTDANAGQSYLYSITNQPSFGTATLSQTGLLSYSPNLGSAIDDSITVRITDTSALAIFSEITIPIDVIENAIPILASNPSSISTFQSQSATAQVSFTDDNSNQTHTYGIQTASQNGTVTISQQGLLTYNPTIGFSGNDSVTVYVEDNANPPGRGKLIIPITVTANTTPLLSSTPASVDTFQGTLATGTISFVDPDPGQSHTFAVVNSGTKGIAAIDQLGNFTYTPNQGETGADSIEFSVKDNANPPATGTITLAVNIIANTNPVIAGDNSLSTFQSTQIESIYTISDIDQGQNLNLEIANSTTNGSLSLSQITGTDQYRVTYFPDTGFSGTDSFILRGRDDANPNGEVFFPVSITIEANSLPIVSDASLAFVQSDNPKSLQISFTDPDANQTHTFGVQTSPSKGDVQISSEGLLTYTPFFDQSGSDSFEISVSDSATPSGVGTAIITVNIDPNSAPVLDPIADVSIKTSSSQTIAVTANDINPNQDLNYRITQFPTEVSAFINFLDGSLEITAGQNYTGPDSLEVTVNDNGAPFLQDSQIVNINIQQGNFPPNPSDQFEAIVAGSTLETIISPNDPDAGDQHTFAITSGPQNGSANIDANGLLVYISNNGFTGPDQVEVTITDNGDPILSAVAVIDIQVDPNSPPMPSGTDVDILAGRSVDIVVDPNDPDVVQEFTFEVVGSPGIVTASVDENGNLNLSSTLASFGAESVTIRVTDNGSPALSGDAIYDVNVIENTAPTVNDAFATISKNEVLNGEIEWFDNNSDLQTFTFEVVTPAINGISSIDSNGFATYTPNADYVGTDQFVVRVTDDAGQFDEGTINIEITDGNQPPVIERLGYSLRDPSGPYRTRFRLRANDSDGSIVRAEWDFGDGSPISTLDPNIIGERAFLRVFHNYASEGTYNVTVTVFDNDGASDQFVKTVTVTESLPPVPRFNVSAISGTAPLSLDFDGTSSFDPDGTIDYVEWYVPQTDELIEGFNATLNFPNPGVYNVELYLEDNDAIVSTFNIPIFVDQPQENVLPFFNFIRSYSQSDTVPFNVSTGVNGEIDFDGSIIDIVHYAGEDLGPDQTYASSADYSYGVFGTYESKILVRDDSGEATLKSRYIHVGPAEAPEMGIFPIQVGPREIEFDTIVKGHYVSDSFYWDLGDGTFVNEPNPRHTYANPGNYTVRVYYFDVYGRLHENSHLFYIDETVYSPQIVGNLANYQEVQIGESVTLDLSGSNDPSGQPMIGYTVDFSNLDLGSTGNDSTTYNTVGIHRIRAYGENGLGLFGKNEFFVNVLNGVGPNPVANADVTSGPAPFSFTLDASGSTGNITKLNWKTYDLSNEFGLPGGTENAIENVTIDTPGFYNFELWVKDDLGNTRISEIEIEVTN